MRLFLDIGQYDRSASQGVRSGSCVAVVGESGAAAAHGVLLACAEAIAGRPDGEQAVRSAITALSDTYYSGDLHARRELLQQGLDAANLALRAGGERGRAAAVAALLLRDQHWIIGHAGHIRVWRYRDHEIKQLTRDHLLPRAPGKKEVAHACGYNDTIDADYSEGELEEGDIFLLTSPGVHDALDGSILRGVLQSDTSAQQMAEALVRHALAVHTPAYAGACIARVEKLPRGVLSTAGGEALPVIAPPPPGTELDGFVLEKMLVKSRRFRLYKAQDRESGDTVMLRFPDPSRKEGAQAFLREEAVFRRVDSPYLLKPVALRAGRRSALYGASSHRKVESLVKRIRRKHFLPLAEALQLGDQLLSALETLHQQGVIHGDVRPHNVLYDKSKRQIYVLGLAATLQSGSPRGNHGSRSGILNYRAPELFDNRAATERSDIYGAAVTLYRMVTGRYPYGEIGAGVDWRRLQYIPARQVQPDLPARLDDVLGRACALDPADRYASVAQFAAALGGITIAEPAGEPASATASSRAKNKWIWSVAAALAAALAAYLYATLR